MGSRVITEYFDEPRINVLGKYADRVPMELILTVLDELLSKTETGRLGKVNIICDKIKDGVSVEYMIRPCPFLRDYPSVDTEFIKIHIRPRGENVNNQYYWLRGSDREFVKDDEVNGVALMAASYREQKRQMCLERTKDSGAHRCTRSIDT